MCTHSRVIALGVIRMSSNEVATMQGPITAAPIGPDHILEISEQPQCVARVVVNTCDVLVLIMSPCD